MSNRSRLGPTFFGPVQDQKCLQGLSGEDKWPQAGKEINCFVTRPGGYKTFFMPNSTEQEISTAQKN